MTALSIKVFDCAKSGSSGTELRQLAAKVSEEKQSLANLDSKTKNEILLRVRDLIRQHKDDIILVNNIDIKNAEEKGLNASMIDRLVLNDARIEGICKSLTDLVALEDPVGKIIWENERPNGLKIFRKTVPLGVIGMIYEARPNVTVDAWALCFKSGNAVILRPGSECFATSKKFLSYIHMALKEYGLAQDLALLVPSPERVYVDEMLQLSEYIDVIIPRGGKGLIEKVIAKSKIPIFRHLDGNCHSYIHKDADHDKAIDLVLNAKLRRVGICGATESLLIDREIAVIIISRLANKLLENGCEIRADDFICDLVPEAKLATDGDYAAEYLDKIISIKSVTGVQEAVAHINKYGSSHTDAIITEDKEAAEYFLQNVDSSIVMLNSSTQFADGGEFGLGAEIGIATGKMHARGPVGLEQLVIYKYQVYGTGQTRP